MTCVSHGVADQKEELLNLSESAGESAVAALRADITALNASLHDSHINMVSNSSQCGLLDINMWKK